VLNFSNVNANLSLKLQDFSGVLFLERMEVLLEVLNGVVFLLDFVHSLLKLVVAMLKLL